MHYTQGKTCTLCGFTTSFERILHRMGKDRICEFCYYDIPPPPDTAERIKQEIMGTVRPSKKH